MKAPSSTYEALARALTPPCGEAGALPTLGLSLPEARALGREHVALFGRAGHAVLAPYEVVHRGTTLHAILACYVRFGFVPDPGFHDRLDHVSLQLALAADLTASPRAVERGSQAHTRTQRQYFLERLWPWVPAWFERMASLRDYPLHRELARVARAFLAKEGARLGASMPKGRAGTRPSQPFCTECGRPVGFVVPRGSPAPPHLVCARCRIRANLRRFGS